MRYIFSFLLLSLVLLNGCLPPEEVDTTTINYDLFSTEVKQIYELQDRQEVDSLLLLLNDPFATQRYWAARAFGSIKSEQAVDSLARLLNDEVEAIRVAAAYALGQIGDAAAAPALITAFVQEDSTGIHQTLNSTILEAVGKTAPKNFLKALSTTKSYQISDTTLLLGQVRGIYRYMLRGMTNLESTERMLAIAQETAYPNSVRLVAAHYLLRATDLGLDTLRVDTTLATAFRQAEDVHIRMALAMAVGKTRSNYALQNLMEQFNQTEEDYRVRCNILRAFRYFEYPQTRDLVFTALRSPQPQIAQTAVEHLIRYGYGRDANGYRQIARDTSLSMPVRIGLLTAANRNLANYFADYKKRTNYALRKIFESSENSYEQAATLRALAYSVNMYSYIGEISENTTDPIIRTASMEALKTICEDEELEVIVGSRRAPKVVKAIGNFLLKGIQSKAPGTMAVASEALRVPQMNFRTILADSLPILQTALESLVLPKQIETYHALQATIRHFEGKSPEAQQSPAYNHPIDWEILETGNFATLSTSKGEIALELLVDAAPASVSNFISLVNEGYYNGKNFHRIVPNFVVQGGCPIGNGYGSLDYTIRSELPPIYYD
ncbi:MAG: HEAT repeat domain-containing protein, partial [Bacteroidota bacterium]